MLLLARVLKQCHCAIDTPCIVKYPAKYQATAYNTREMAPVIRNFAFLILLNISAVCAKDWRSKLHFAWTSHSGLAWVDKVRFLL